MRIALKLTGSFLAIALLVAAAGYLAQRTGRELELQMERLSHGAIRRSAAVSEVTDALYASLLAAHQQIAARRDTSDGVSRSDDLLTHEPTTSETRILATYESAELMATLTEDSSASLQSGLDQHHQLMKRFRDLLEVDVDEAERFLEGSVRVHFERELLPNLATIREKAERESTGGIRSVERALAVAAQRRGILLVATAFVALSIGLFMSRAIGKPLDALQKAAREIGQGHFDTRVEIRSRDEIGTLGAVINGMAAQLREKTVSKDHVDNIIHSMQEMLIVTDANFQIRLVNPAACGELGYTPEKLTGQPLQNLFGSENVFSGGKLTPDLAAGLEGHMIAESGDRVPVHFSAAEMRDEVGQLTGVVCVALNISQQKETENRLRASIHEKELLLKEVHHRVKNNLQVISSLLSLQSQEVRNPGVTRLFQESQARIRSMALVHEQLYRSDDLAHIDFAAYVRELVNHLKQGYGTVAARVSFEIDVQPTPCLLDLAIPCGMIVNELVANALEHAFAEDRPGVVRIQFEQQDDRYRLTVADNGVGIRDKAAIDKATSVGLKVVKALSRQIHGSIDHNLTDGTSFSISFEAPERQRLNENLS